MMFRWIAKFFASGVSGISHPIRWFSDWFDQVSESDSGMVIDEKTAIGYAPVWYAVSRIAGHVCTLPLTPMRRLERGAEKATTHPAYRLVRTRPNPFQSAAQFKETLMAHALLRGNGKAAIVRQGGKPKELILILPSNSVTCYVDGEKWHAVRLGDDDRLKLLGGTRGSVRYGDWVKIPDEDVLHIPGLGVDGTIGLEVYEVSKNTFGLGLAAEKAANKDFANGSVPGVLLEAPKGTFRTQREADEFIANFDKFHAGLDNRRRTGLLREGITAKTMDHSSQEAQWVEQRLFQRQEVALLFVLESILGDDTSVSYNSVEQKNLAYLSNCLMRWLVKIEQECDEKLLSPRQKASDSHFFKFNTATLLRADFRSTVESLSMAIQARIMSPNEARERLDMNPYEGGDEYENPAITPGHARDDNNSEAGTVADPEEANRTAIIAHLKHRISVEAGHVLRAAGNQGNYVAWLEKFYDGKWSKTMENAIENIGGDRTLGKAHCERSKNELLDIAGTVTQDGLADAVSEVVSRWPERAETLAAEIIKGELASV